MTTKLTALERFVNKDCRKVKAEAARRLGVSRQFLGRVLKGEARMPEEMAERLGGRWVFNKKLRTV